MNDYLKIYSSCQSQLSDEEYFKEFIRSFYYIHDEVSCAKDTSSRYAAISKTMAAKIGLPESFIIGKTSFEMSSRVSSMTMVYLEQDRLVETSRQKHSFANIHNDDDLQGIYISHKSPIINPATNTVLGTYCNIEKYTGNSIINIIKIIASIHDTQKKNLKTSSDKKTRSLVLTQREEDVLFCVANGLMDRNAIAAFLSKVYARSIGANTVKNMLMSIYGKLYNINSMPLLYEYAIKNNYHLYIPNSLIEELNNPLANQSILMQAKDDKTP